MGERPDRTKAESVGAVVGRMGRERRALLASKTAVVLLQVCALLCLLPAAASLAGYLPRAVGPALVLTAASVVGFVLAAIEARRA
jgi:hypothetical protein